MTDQAIKDIEDRIRQINIEERSKRLKEMQRIDRETKERDEIRSQVVKFLNEFNHEHYEIIRPFLERTPYHFFTIAHGGIKIDAHYTGAAYSIALGDQPMIITPEYYTNPNSIHSHRKNYRAINLGLGKIVEKDDSPPFYTYIIDVGDIALDLTRYNSLKPFETFQSEVNRRFGDSLHWLIEHIGRNEK